MGALGAIFLGLGYYIDRTGSRATLGETFGTLLVSRFFTFFGVLYLIGALIFLFIYLARNTPKPHS